MTKLASVACSAQDTSTVAPGAHLGIECIKIASSCGQLEEFGKLSSHFEGLRNRPHVTAQGRLCRTL